MRERLTFVNGHIYPTEEASVNVEDRALQFGDGIYEVLRIAHGKLFSLDRHMHRMKRGAEQISLEVDDLSSRVESIGTALIGQSETVFGQLYVQLTRGASQRLHPFPRPAVDPTLILTVSDLPMRTKDIFEQGETAITVRDIRWLHCDIKTTSMLGNVLAKEEAVSRRADEAIFVRDDQMVTEGASTNVFIVRNGTIFTHPDGPLVLPGITKEIVRDLTKQLGLPLVEEPFSVAALLAADEVFVTSTTHDVCPILAIDGQPVANGKSGEITRTIGMAFLNLYESDQNLERV